VPHAQCVKQVAPLCGIAVADDRIVRMLCQQAEHLTVRPPRCILVAKIRIRTWCEACRVCLNIVQDAWELLHRNPFAKVVGASMGGVH
jgi:hypothetical protein